MSEVACFGKIVGKRKFPCGGHRILKYFCHWDGCESKGYTFEQGFGEPGSPIYAVPHHGLSGVDGCEPSRAFSTIEPVQGITASELRWAHHVLPEQ